MNRAMVAAELRAVAEKIAAKYKPSTGEFGSFVEYLDKEADRATGLIKARIELMRREIYKAKKDTSKGFFKVPDEKGLMGICGKIERLADEMDRMAKKLSVLEKDTAVVGRQRRQKFGGLLASERRAGWFSTFTPETAWKQLASASVDVIDGVNDLIGVIHKVADGFEQAGQDMSEPTLEFSALCGEFDSCLKAASELFLECVEFSEKVQDVHNEFIDVWFSETGAR